MIARICGKITGKSKNSLYIDVQGICYEVYVPQTVMVRLQDNLDSDGRISLFTYHYLQVEPSRSVPIIIGFLNEVEKEFFEQFITVAGIGPRAALRALSRPISDIAQAINDGDISLLKSLPGIGLQKAKEIIAKLQGKVGKYGLIQDKITYQPKEETKDIEEEALEVLLRLQYKRKEAKEMIQRALRRAPHLKSTEELLNEVYRQRFS